MRRSWRYALERKDLLGTYLIDMDAMLFGMPNALLPAFGALFDDQNVDALLLRLPSGWAKHVVCHGHAAMWRAADMVSGALWNQTIRTRLPRPASQPRPQFRRWRRALRSRFAVITVGPSGVPQVPRASRIGQRLLHYSAIRV